MSQRILVIRSPQGDKRIVLEKERMLIGRDETCEIVLDDSSISRKHAVLLWKFGVVYLENISATGQILVDQKPVEFCELNPQQEAHLGPFVLFWENQNAESSPGAPAGGNVLAQSIAGASISLDSATDGWDPKADEVHGLTGDMVPAQSKGDDDNFKSERSDDPPVSLEIDSSSDADNNQAAPDFADFSPSGPDEPKPVAEIENPDLSLEAALDPSDPREESDEEPSLPQLSQALSPLGQTQVIDQALKPVIRVTRGERIGREIKLDNGVEWTFGRSAKSTVQIDSSKLSRFHFKIVRVGLTYRLQDLGSANGTRLNGVAMSDAPLHSFDTIQAGPVEFQFLLMDPKAESFPVALSSSDSSAPRSPMLETRDENPHEKTAFSPLVPFTERPQQSPGVSDDLLNRLASQASQSVTGQGASRAKKKFSLHRPTNGRILLYSFFALFLGALAYYHTLEDPNKPVAVNAVLTQTTTGDKVDDPSKRDPAQSATPPLDKNNAASPGQISEEFSQLSPEKQNEIKELYAKAERAQAAKDWTTAFESSKKILDTVKKFRNTTDILTEAQNNLNENQIGMMTQSLNNVKDAQKDNQEQIDLFLEAGDKAIGEKRWEDAQESFAKALNLDPTNARATQGMAAALAKNPNASVDAPTEAINENESQDLAAAQAEHEAFQGLKLQYQAAKKSMNNGNFREAIPVLKDLDQKVQRRIDEIGAGMRGPASIRDEIAEDSKRLQSTVREALDTAKTQLHVEYQTQFADATEFENNKQFVQAREIYDRIVKNEPDFDEPKDLRDRLHSKIIAEARNLYQEALIYEAVGDLDQALNGFQKTKEFLTNVDKPLALEYYKKASQKAARLQR